MTKQEKLANYEMMKNECFETRKLNDSLGKLIVVKNKKIKELEQKLEQTEKDLADYQFNYPTIKELQKENAELKDELKKWKDEWQEQVQKATDEGYARTLQTIQLSKAKELIKNLMVYVPVDLKEYEEAKQFLRGE